MFSIRIVAKLWVQSVVIIMLEHSQGEKFGLDPVAIWPQRNQLPPGLEMSFIHHDQSQFLQTSPHSEAYLPTHRRPHSPNIIIDGCLGFAWRKLKSTPWKQPYVDYQANFHILGGTSWKRGCLEIIWPNVCRKAFVKAQDLPKGKATFKELLSMAQESSPDVDFSVAL